APAPPLKESNATDQDQWRRAHDRRRPADAALVGHSRHCRPHWNQIRLRRRRLHRSSRRQAVRSCLTSLADAQGHEIVTIEGLSADGSHPVQRAWEANNVPQCGYCQPGQIMQAAALLKQTPHPTDQEIVDAMTGNICRCGTYQRIKQAIKSAAEAV